MAFDQYSKKYHKEGTRSGRREASQCLFKVGQLLLNIRLIIRGLGSDIFHALPFFYSFTGCDTFSSFCVKGKCKAYDIWVKSERKDDFFDDVFVELAEKPTDVISDHIDMLTLAAAWLDRYKSSQIMTCTYYRQARKLYTNIFMVLLIKLGICGEGVLKN